MRGIRLLIGALIVSAHAACEAPLPPDTGMIRVTGTVRYMTLEGGFWAVRGDDGTTYDPVDGLPSEFQHDGLRVLLEARVRHDLASIHMAGPLIEIIRIQRL